MSPAQGERSRLKAVPSKEEAAAYWQGVVNAQATSLLSVREMSPAQGERSRLKAVPSKQEAAAYGQGVVDAEASSGNGAAGAKG